MHLVEAQAYCENCDWKVESKNAMGVAAKHYYRTGHKVFVELGYVHIYGLNIEEHKSDNEKVNVRSS